MIHFIILIFKNIDLNWKEHTRQIFTMAPGTAQRDDCIITAMWRGKKSAQLKRGYSSVTQFSVLPSLRRSKRRNKVTGLWDHHVFCVRVCVSVHVSVFVSSHFKSHSGKQFSPNVVCTSCHWRVHHGSSFEFPPISNNNITNARRVMQGQF
jgi:hypothetical protein